MEEKTGQGVKTSLTQQPWAKIQTTGEKWGLTVSKPGKQNTVKVNFRFGHEWKQTALSVGFLLPVQIWHLSLLQNRPSQPWLVSNLTWEIASLSNQYTQYTFLNTEKHIENYLLGTSNTRKYKLVGVKRNLKLIITFSKSYVHNTTKQELSHQNDIWWEHLSFSHIQFPWNFLKRVEC